MLTSLVVSRTGDWLRDVLDPTLRGRILTQPNGTAALRARGGGRGVVRTRASECDDCPRTSGTPPTQFGVSPAPHTSGRSLAESDWDTDAIPRRVSALRLHILSRVEHHAWRGERVWAYAS